MDKHLQKSQSNNGVLKYNCPVCGQGFRYKRGRVKNPKVKDVNGWIERARCPYCGSLLRIKDPKGLLRQNSRPKQRIEA